MNSNQTNTQNDQKFESNNFEYRNYEYKRVATLKQHIKCFSFAYNTNNTILFVGQDEGEIKILGLNSHTKLIQTFCTFSGRVVCLIWRKKSNSLISGHLGRFVIWNVWNQPIPFQILVPRCQILQCMILNEDEDLLVSGSFEKHIEFWKNESEGWTSTQILETPVSATCLSFNSSQNKLILCGSFRSVGQYIIVIEQQNDKNWAIAQTIQFQDHSLPETICFINDNQFAYHQGKYLQIYDYNQKNNKFLESQRIQNQKSKVIYWDPYSQFSRESNFLMVKQGKYVNYFSQDTNGDFFLLKNSIKFGSTYIFGRLSDDGRYQVTWDGNKEYFNTNNGSNEIQIRKIKQSK